MATLCGNRLELLDVILGCNWMGAVGVPLNVAVRGDALRRALTNSGARVLAVDPALLPVLGVVDLPAGLEQVWQAAARRRVAWSGPARQAEADRLHLRGEVGPTAGKHFVENQLGLPEVIGDLRRPKVRADGDAELVPPAEALPRP